MWYCCKLIQCNDHCCHQCGYAIVAYHSSMHRYRYASTNTNTMLEIVREGVPIERLAEVNIPVPLADVVERATRRDPETRYANASEMLAQLEQALDEMKAFVSPTRLATWLDSHGLYR